ncbi:MAG: hypothetical protein R3C99_22610 [Pirellulaceae bacterium]
MNDDSNGCPVDDSTRQWINARTGWLMREFGRDWLCSRSIVLLTRSDFPEPFTNDEASARVVFERLCEFVDFPTDKIQLQFWNIAPRASDGAVHFVSHEVVDDRIRIDLNAALLHEPVGLTAALASELARIRLDARHGMSNEEDDDEMLAELFTVMLGLGVLTSNGAIFESTRDDGGWTRWEMRQRSQMTLPTYGYALALFAHLRGDIQCAWQRHLRLDVRTAFRRSVKFLNDFPPSSLDGLWPTTARPTTSLRTEDDVAADQTDSADQRRSQASQEQSVPLCRYCGEALFADDQRDICIECRKSIEENELEMESDEANAYATTRRAEAFAKIGCLIVAIVFVAILVWAVIRDSS